MQLEKIQKIIEKEIAANNYCFSTQYESKSSTSLYYIIHNSKGVTLLFRVSDHATPTKVITLRIDNKSLTEKQVQRFIRNRINDLKKRSLKELLGMR